MSQQTHNYLNHISDADWTAELQALLPLLGVLERMHAKALALQGHIHAVSLTETDPGVLELLEEGNQKAGSIESKTGEIRRLLRELTNAHTEIVNHHDRVIGAAEDAGYAIPEAAAKGRREREAKREAFEQLNLKKLAAQNAKNIAAHKAAQGTAGLMAETGAAPGGQP